MAEIDQNYKSGYDAGVVAGRMAAILDTCNHDQACRNARELGASEAKKELTERFTQVLQSIRDYVWDRDIPSPTVPEYVEHHRDCLEIMKYIESCMEELNA